MKLDITRLHDRVSNGRNSGRTTRMLVEAIQQVDFIISPYQTVFVLGPTTEAAKRLQNQALDIARQLGYDVEVVSPTDLRVDGRILFRFISEQGAAHHISGYLLPPILFGDHSCRAVWHECTSDDKDVQV